MRNRKRRSFLVARARRSTPPAIWMGCVLLCALIQVDAPAQTNSPATQEIHDDMNKAQEALRANQPGVAAQAYEDVLRLDPNNVEARANLGVVAMSNGNWSKAAENLEAALKLQPAQTKVQALLGLCLLHLGRPAEARDLLTSAVPALENSKLKHEAGLALISAL